MSPRTSLQHLAPSEGKSIVIGEFGFTFKVGLTNDSGYSIAEVTIPPGAVNPLHRHPSEETMYVLAGEFEFYGDDVEPRRAGAGAVMYVPPNTAHGLANVGHTDGRLLIVVPREQEVFLNELAKRRSP